VAVDLQDVAQRILHKPSDRASPLEVLSNRHSLLSTSCHNPSGQAFNVRILNTEVEDARLPVLEVVRGTLGVIELEDFDSNPVTSG
jgi:hypothetical protein